MSYSLWRQTVMIVVATVAVLLSQPVVAASATGKSFSCAKVPDPVVALSYGSRYTEGDDSHSAIDVESDADVTNALKPVDSFVASLMRMSNDALFEAEHKQARADCVATSIAAWAKADALTGLDSLDAKLSIGARLAGFAIAYQQAKASGTIDPATRVTVENWLTDRAVALSDFFDQNSKMMASRNNLRAWTGLAVGAVGLATSTPKLVEWGRQSFTLVACQAGADGSLPLEMRRAGRALSYQLHAIAPLVLSATLFASPQFDGFTTCDNALQRIAGFTLAAVKDPSIVEKLSGKPQSFKAGDERQDAFVMGWAEPYLAHVHDAALDAFVAPMRPLSNSKLGGDLTALYRKPL